MWLLGVWIDYQVLLYGFNLNGLKKAYLLKIPFCIYPDLILEEMILFAIFIEQC